MDTNDKIIKAIFDKVLLENPKFTIYGIGNLQTKPKDARKRLEKSFEEFKVSTNYLVDMDPENICRMNSVQHALILSNCTMREISPGVVSLAAKALGYKMKKFQGNPYTLFVKPKEPKSSSKIIPNS